MNHFTDNDNKANSDSDMKNQKEVSKNQQKCEKGGVSNRVINKLT